MNTKAIIEATLPAWFGRLYARVETSPLGYRIVRGASWSMLSGVVARGLGLISSILVARLLGKTGFGELGIIQSTIGMFGTLAGFGLGMTATKFIAQYRTIDPMKAGRIRGLSSGFAWITSSITSLVLFVTAPLLAEKTLMAPQLAPLLRIGSLFLLLTSVTGAQSGALAGFEAFRRIATISILCGLANFPLMVGGVYIAGLEGAVWGMVIVTALNWLLNHIAIRKECAIAKIPYMYTGSWIERNVLWRFALPAVVSSVLLVPAEWVLNAMLVNQPDGYGQMGILSAAKQWNYVILFLPNMFSNVTLPILSNLFGEGKRQQYNKMLVGSSILLTSAALIIAFHVSLFSKVIMSSYGIGFAEGWLVLVLISVYSVLWASNIVVGQAMWSAGATREAMVFAAIRAFILTLSGYVLVKYGAVGISAALMLTHLLQTIYLIPYVKYKTSKHFNSLEISRAHTDLD